MSLIWKQLSYFTDASPIEKVVSRASFNKIAASNRREILCSVYGRINLGEVGALMGPSGAGKSTLINCLISGKNYHGCQGEILVSGVHEPIRASVINQNEGDHLISTLTVKESLLYASKLKNNPITPDRVHKATVEDLIQELSLDSCQNNAVEKCSEGEKKRLAIGLELTGLKKPHFLFLDEPTSGLDSFVGFKVIKVLSQLAKAHNMAIIATIHQPSYKLFAQFDKAFILTGRGQIMFNDKPTQLKSVLEDCGYDFDIGLYENPADVAIELASSMKRQPTSEDDVKEDLVHYYDDNCILINHQKDLNPDSALSGENTENDSYKSIGQKMLDKVEHSYTDHVDQLQTDYETVAITRQEKGICRNEAKFTFYNLKILYLRCCRTSIINQKKFTFMKLILHLVVAAVLAILYHRDIGKADSCIAMVYPEDDYRNCTCMVTPETLRGKNGDLSQKNVSFQFFSLLFLMFASLMPTVLSFPSEMKLFLCEYRNGWYSSSTYYIAKTLTEIPMQLLFPTLYVYFLYWYSAQFGMEASWDIFGIFHPSSRFSHFLYVTILCCFIAQGLGFLIGILCVKSFNISIILSSSLLLFLFLFSGFFVKRVQMSGSVSWLTYFSFVSFGLESLLLIIYGDSRCAEPKYSSVLVLFDLDDRGITENVFMLLFHLVVTRLVAFVFFKNKADPMVFGVDIKAPLKTLRSINFSRKKLPQHRTDSMVELVP